MPTTLKDLYPNAPSVKAASQISVADIQAGNERNAARLEGAGIEAPKPKGPNFLQRLFGVIQTPSVGVRSVLFNLINDPGEDVNPLEMMGKSLKGQDTTVVEGANLVKEVAPQITNKWALMGLGLGVDIGTDPLSYVGLGYNAIAKNAAKAAIITGGAADFGFDTARMVAKAAELGGAQGDDLIKAAQIIDKAGIAPEVANALSIGQHADQYELYHKMLKAAAEVLPEAKSGVRFAGIPLGGQGTLDKAAQIGRESLARVPGITGVAGNIRQGPITAMSVAATTKKMAIKTGSLSHEAQLAWNKAVEGFDDATLEAAQVAQEAVVPKEYFAIRALKDDANEVLAQLAGATEPAQLKKLAAAGKVVDEANLKIGELLKDAVAREPELIAAKMAELQVPPDEIERWLQQGQPALTRILDDLHTRMVKAGLNENRWISEAESLGRPSLGYAPHNLQTEALAAPETFGQAIGLSKAAPAVAKEQPILASELVGTKPGPTTEVVEQVMQQQPLTPEQIAAGVKEVEQRVPVTRLVTGKDIPILKTVNVNDRAEVSAAMLDQIDQANQRLIALGEEPLDFAQLVGKGADVSAGKLGVNPPGREYAEIPDLIAGIKRSGEIDATKKLPNLNLRENVDAKIRGTFARLAEADRQDAIVAMGKRIIPVQDEVTGKMLPVAPEHIAAQVGGMDVAAGMKLQKITRNGVDEFYAVPKDVAKVFDQLHATFTDDEAVKGFLKAFDQVQTLWKKSATRWNVPVYNARNATWNAWLMNLKGALDPETYALGKALMAGKRLDETLTLGTWTGTGQEFLDMALAYGGREGQFLKGQIGRAAGMPATSALGKLDEATGTIANYFEDSDHLAVFANGLKKGLSPSASAGRVADTLYDFSPETSTMFERQFAQRLIPFWKWMFNNTKNMVATLFKDPGQISALGHASNTGQAVNPVDKSLMPEYMKDMLAIPLPLKNKQGVTLVANPNSPVSDLRNLGLPFEPRVAMSNLTPLLRVPIEVMTNKSWYYDAPIANYTGQLTPVPGIVQQFDKRIAEVPVFSDVWNKLKDTFEMKYKTDSAGNEVLSGNAYANYMVKGLTPWINNVSKLVADETRTPQDRLAYFTSLKLIAYDAAAYEKQAAYVAQQELQDAVRKAKDEGEIPKTATPKKVKLKFKTAKKPRKLPKAKALPKVKVYKGKTVSLKVRK